MNKCKNCGQSIDHLADRVSVHGMYDCHAFEKYEAPTVDGLINKWIEHISKPIPAILGGRHCDDLGPTTLCPAIVLCGSQELRRVGRMIIPDDTTRKPKMVDVEAYKQALLNDPDIPRLLMAQYSTLLGDGDEQKRV